MKKSTLLILIYFCLLEGQAQILDLNFYTIQNGQTIFPDSIEILSLINGTDTTLYAPDHTLVLECMSDENESFAIDPGTFQFFQNIPNPFDISTSFNLYNPEKSHVSVTVSDQTGELFLTYTRVLDKGFHSFLFTAGAARIYIVKATTRFGVKAIKMIPRTSASDQCNLVHTGCTSSSIKSTGTGHQFTSNPGDPLQFTGYFGPYRSSFIDSPEATENYVFLDLEFPFCPGQPTVIYEGETYPTLLIGDQCWFRKNLNVGQMITVTSNQTDNGILEKYCYDNDPENCEEYGGLYQWDEMMHYAMNKTKGICPYGWHVPSDLEWCLASLHIDPSVNCYANGWSGTDISMKMRSTSGWYASSNGSNESGFTALPGGLRNNYGGLWGFEQGTSFWTSSYTNVNSAWMRALFYSESGIGRTDDFKTYGYSVRCIKD
jgi:uncharacterized protein (TIGR02145 family)